MIHDRRSSPHHGAPDSRGRRAQIAELDPHVQIKKVKDRFANAFGPQLINAGQTVITEGKPHKDMPIMIVVSGELKEQKRILDPQVGFVQKTICVHGVGGVAFIQSACKDFAELPAATSIVAEVDTQVMLVPAEQFREDTMAFLLVADFTARKQALDFCVQFEGADKGELETLKAENARLASRNASLEVTLRAMNDDTYAHVDETTSDEPITRPLYSSPPVVAGASTPVDDEDDEDEPRRPSGGTKIYELPPELRESAPIMQDTLPPPPPPPPEPVPAPPLDPPITRRGIQNPGLKQTIAFENAPRGSMIRPHKK